MQFLPLLGIELSLNGDGWELAESEAAQRRLIASALEIHRKKGTPASIRNLIRQLGFGEIDLIEGISRARHDGQFNYDGKIVYGHAGKWATYRVILRDRAITNEQAAQLKAALANIAPARCTLAELNYQTVAIRHNGQVNYDGSYNYGSV